MSTLVTFAKTKGFVYQWSEIYGGLANSWDYGPLGALLKENIKNLWIREFVQKRKDMVLLDAAIMMNPNVWVASGHVGSFSDPLIDCKACNKRFRADKLIEEKISYWLDALGYCKKVYWESKEWIDAYNNNLKLNWNPKTPNQAVDKAHNFYQSFITTFDQNNQKEMYRLILIGPREILQCPECKKADWWKIQDFNLMLSTRQWVIDGEWELIYLRPETAQGIFVNFPNIARSTRKKIPFGVAQCGKAFRNEITPKNFIFRTREFEQIEIEYFCKPGTDVELFETWLIDEGKFFTEVLGFKDEKVRFVEIPKEGLPHYSKRAGDFEYLFPFGWGEISTLANRTDYDLRAHMEHSKADLSYFDPFDNTKYIPFVIEPSIWLSRLTLAAMCDAYDEIPGEEWTSKVVMRFAPAVAPIKVGVFPLVKKFAEQASALYDLLSSEFMCEYDEAGTIGKRYQRADEIGIPYSICVEPENYDQCQVTVRDRDSGEQEIVKIDSLVAWLKAKGC